MTASTRRSGRKRKANSKYLGTGWDKNTLRLLRESSESSNSSPSDDSVKEDGPVDHDFTGQIIADAEAVSWSEDEDASDVSNAAAIRTPLGSAEDIASVGSPGVITPEGNRRQIPAGNRVAGNLGDVDSGRCRGLVPANRRSSRFSRIFGPDHDSEPLLHARDTWLQDHDKSLPCRQTLAAIQSSQNEAADLSEDPNAEEGDVNIVARQELELTDLASEEAARYLIPNAARQSVALGPVGLQKLFKAEYSRPLGVSRAWAEATLSHAAENTLNADLKPQAHFQKGPNGWIVHVGEKVQSLAWLPGNDEDAQVLAVASRSTSKQRTAVDGTPIIRSPAFSPSASYPSCVQLWAFYGSDSRNTATSRRSSQASREPERRIAYALDAGDVRQLQWQPSTTHKHLKLLAMLSTDGCVRLLALNPADLEGKPPACNRVKTASMQIQSPPDTVFTTMCWAAPSDLILGVSDGTIRIYNVLDHTNTTPYLSLALHITYILNIISTFPSSSIPTFIASTSAAGDLLLTDLRAPHQDQVHVPKARLPTKPLIYLPHTRSFITVTDTTGISEPRHTASLVQCHDLRHFYQSRQICKLPTMSGAATALAGSPHHPCILIGNAKGSVFATNYLRRVLPRKGASREWDGYLQTVYEYDWRPMTAAEQQANDDNDDDDDDADTSSNGSGKERAQKPPQDQSTSTTETAADLFHGHDVRPGISRFTEDCFLPSPIDMSTKPPKKTPGRNKRKRSSGAGAGAGAGRKQKSDKDKDKAAAAEEAARYGSDVIFEEEQAVTCVEWNPNLRFAGWAAVGWGSGIVRVEDLSHDGGGAGGE